MKHVIRHRIGEMVRMAYEAAWTPSPEPPGHIILVTTHVAMVQYLHLVWPLDTLPQKFVHELFMPPEAVNLLTPSDTVVGRFPPRLAAAVCAQGAQYYSIELSIPKDWRGRELSLDEIKLCRPRLRRYFMAELDTDTKFLAK